MASQNSALADSSAPSSLAALAEQLRDGPLQRLVELQIQTTALANRLDGKSAGVSKTSSSSSGCRFRRWSTSMPSHVSSPWFSGSLPMPRSHRTELRARLLELCEEFRAHGDIGCEAALDESHTHFAEEVGAVVFRTVRELLDKRSPACAGEASQSLERAPPRRIDRHYGSRRRHRAAAAQAPRQPPFESTETAEAASGSSTAGCATSGPCSISTQPPATGRARWSSSRPPSSSATSRPTTKRSTPRARDRRLEAR